MGSGRVDMASFSTQEICEKVGGELIGPADLTVSGVDRLETAEVGQISFIRDRRFAGDWAGSNASAAFVGRDVNLEPGEGRALIVVDSADLAVAVVLDLFAEPVPGPVGIHASAIVDPTAKIGSDTVIGAGCFVGPNVVIGDGCVVHPNVTIMDQTTIGDGCEFFPGVVIRERCRIDNRVILHANVSIGTDGFNYRPSNDSGSIRLVKITHIGTVELHDDVEIGANSCVDRGKFAATVIGSQTKIDNLCQIGHNCRIGQRCVIAGGAGFAGSVTIHDDVMMGGHVGIREHTIVGRGARLGAQAVVMNDVPPGESWVGTPARPVKSFFREYAALRRLPTFMKEMKRANEKVSG